MTESPQPCTHSPVPDAKSLHKHGAESDWNITPSPVKQNIPISTREDIENSHMAQKPEDVDVATFMKEHLTARPAGKGYVVPRKPNVEKIINAKGEAKIYAPVCALLNKISKQIYDTYIEAGIALHHADRVLFLDHHTGPPEAPGFHIKDKPDIVGVFGTKKSMKHFFNKKTKSYTGVPYHRIITTGECEPEAEEGAGQAVSYTCQHARARLDMPGTYALFANTRGYRILWSDASEVVKSPFVDWTELGLLEGYIRSLHSPPKNHHLWDPTISSPVVLRDAMGSGSKAHWTITYTGKTYNDCNPFFLPLSWGRRTTVFMYEGGDDDFAVIKDAYRDDAQRFEEATLINDIHAEGIFPGMVRLLDSGNVNGKDGSVIVTAVPADRDKNVVHRTKKRLVMGSRGSQFHLAKTVKDVLKATYDVIEVHRALLKRRRFLHRDLSMPNVLMYPEHSKKTTEGKQFISDPPKFIDEILGDSNNNDDKCRALLIDADNSASLKSELMADPALANALREELTMRTGTPRYIARAVASGTVVNTKWSRIFAPMPSLEDRTKEIYQRVYGQEAYDRYEDTADTFHSGRASSRKAKDVAFVHRPDHDVESLFWLLVAVFLLAKPLGEPDKPTQRFYSAWKHIERHMVAGAGCDDTREPFLSYSVAHWEAALHPGLSSLAPLLENLATQVQPEYALMDPAPPEDHLHEAFRRLILEHIVGMGDADIDLEAGITRETAFPTDGKRKADKDPDQGNRQNSKRSKSHCHSVISVIRRTFHHRSLRRSHSS
ncbi:unnamed protein product [Somion occarium]|uniref:Fungal-type protein kinase domain-containing protein n=1 Tax=Somion occarium TaxID=3059160 RepID=A0ABP1EAX3_9APHY